MKPLTFLFLAVVGLATITGGCSKDRSQQVQAPSPEPVIDAVSTGGPSGSSAHAQPPPPAPPPPPFAETREAETVALTWGRSIPRTSSSKVLRARLARPPGHHFFPTEPGGRGRDRFAAFQANPVNVTSENPVSTFSIDVDTSSYSFMRASLNEGVLPQPNAVRVEELINYFPYDYPAPADPNTPFAVSVSLLPTPWNAGTQLMHIGIKGYELRTEARPPANLVFLIDTSGSMGVPNKLSLVIKSFRLLLEELAPEDTVAIVTYAGSAGTLLAPTRVAERDAILAKLRRLSSGGFTAGGEGIRQAYLLAEQSFVKNGINRVILATDGDFNVGITDVDELKGFVQRKRVGGVYLSVLGFGMGNYNDELMQALAQNGNGHAAYIDSLMEARKVLAEQATSTLFPIAKDVKIQIEFNPAVISEYRLIGYETRMLAREDFRNDKVDAGEIGAGHSVTALYEITPAGSGSERVPPLRYGDPPKAAEEDATGEHAFVKVRYKLPDDDTSKLITRAVTADDEASGPDSPPIEARFAAAVAAFGQLLRGGRHTGNYGYEDVLALALDARGEDRFGYRTEFARLVRLAESAAAMAALPGGQGGLAED